MTVALNNNPAATRYRALAFGVTRVEAAQPLSDYATRITHRFLH